MLARALPLYLAAGLCLSSLDATAKWLVQYHPLFLVVWARYAGQMVVATPFALHRAGPGFWRTRRLRLHLVRSALLLLATVSFFGALRFVPLAEGAAITYLAPIIVLCFWIGLYPRPFFDVLKQPVDYVVAKVNADRSTSLASGTAPATGAQLRPAAAGVDR